MKEFPLSKDLSVRFTYLLLFEFWTFLQPYAWMHAYIWFIGTLWTPNRLNDKKKNSVTEFFIELSDLLKSNTQKLYLFHVIDYNYERAVRYQVCDMVSTESEPIVACHCLPVDKNCCTRFVYKLKFLLPFEIIKFQIASFYEKRWPIRGPPPSPDLTPMD